jgi:hypothetical protein
VSVLPWFLVFERVLQLASRLWDRQADRAQLPMLYDQLMAQKPGATAAGTFTVTLAGHTHTLSPPNSAMLPSLQSDPPLRSVCRTLRTTPLLTLFASLLFERRILITSSALENITCIAHSVSRLLFPLSWQHIFIPIMPEHLLDYCTATVPFVIGVHKSLLPIVQRMPLEPHVIIDVDAGTVASPFDDYNLIPLELVSFLKGKKGKTEKRKKKKKEKGKLPFSLIIRETKQAKLGVKSKLQFPSSFFYFLIYLFFLLFLSSPFFLIDGQAAGRCEGRHG